MVKSSAIRRAPELDIAEGDRPLRDARQEKFASYIAMGHTLEKAHELAGYRPNRANASVLRRTQKVSTRIGAIVAETRAIERDALEIAREKHAIDASRVLVELAKVAFANLGDYVSDDGQVNLARLTRDQKAAIIEYTVDDLSRGRKRIRIKLSSKLDALDKLARHLGLYLDSSTLNVTQNNFFTEKPPTMKEWKAELELDAKATRQSVTSK